MTKEELQVEALIQQIVGAQTDEFLDLAEIAGLNPAEDFSGASLKHANLSGTDLSGTDLSDAELKGAFLSRAN